MRHTLFGKLFTVYMGILLGSFLIVGIVLAGVFQTYFEHNAEQVMIEQGKKIQEVYEMAYYTGIIDRKQLNFEIQILEKYVNAVSWFVDRTGEIYIVSRAENRTWVGKQIPHEIIQQVFEGNTVRIKGGFEKYFKEPVITIGYPIEMDGKVQVALFMHTPLPHVQKSVSEVVWITLRVLSISILVAFVCIYYLAKRMTIPLKKMSKAAKVIADGDFHQRLHIETDDEIGEVAQSFNYMAEELDKLEELRKSFIANISHDLRSPLTSIKGFVQAIMDGTVPVEKQGKYLQIVLDETTRLTRMTNEILDLTKMESGEMIIEKEEFELNEIFRTVLSQMEQRILKKNVDVQLLLAQKQTSVYADPEQMLRVVYNLIDNALKFVDQEGKITIETTMRQQQVVVSIINTGDGIPSEDLNYIWDRFHKVDRSRGKDKKGTGLGLSIVKQIIKQHQENITVSSIEGKCTTFRFTIQCAENI